jgi:tubulin alpha
LNEFQTNLVPFPRFHFLAGAISPLLLHTSNIVVDYPLLDMTESIFERKGSLMQMNPSDGKYMTTTLMFRKTIAGHKLS